MSSKETKEPFNCYTAMDKLAACASRLLRGTKSTPGFCSQNIEVSTSASRLVVVKLVFKSTENANFKVTS